MIWTKVKQKEEIENDKVELSIVNIVRKHFFVERFG
jgi:hypothetical protein